MAVLTRKLWYTVKKEGRPMHFLVDYENVRNLGMRGTEFLLSSDCVILFYSDAALAIEQRHLQNIQRARCGFEIGRAHV